MLEVDFFLWSYSHNLFLFIHNRRYDKYTHMLVHTFVTVCVTNHFEFCVYCVVHVHCAATCGHSCGHSSDVTTIWYCLLCICALCMYCSGWGNHGDVSSSTPYTTTEVAPVNPSLSPPSLCGAERCLPSLPPPSSLLSLPLPLCLQALPSLLSMGYFYLCGSFYAKD